MRRYLLIGLLAAQLLGTTAFAQTAVTLYGSIDTGITYTNNVGGASLWKMADGINKANSLGFAGTEDLGGGMKALFRMENGFSSVTGALGQGGLLFGKQVYLGLSSANAGQVTLGRQYDFMTLMARWLPCFQCGIYVVENADLDRVSGQRLNNSVQFLSRSFGGVKFGAMYAFGDTAAGTTNRGRAVSLSAEYQAGPFGAQIAATDINGAPVLTGVLGTTSVLGVSTAAVPALFVDKQRILGAGASYQLGAWRLATLYTNTQLTLGGRSSTDQILHVGADYRIAPALLLQAKLSVDKFEDSRWNSMNMGLDYNLSKRTDVYVEMAYQRASGPGTRASIALIGPSSTDSQLATRVGIKHLF